MVFLLQLIVYLSVLSRSLRVAQCLHRRLDRAIPRRQGKFAALLEQSLLAQRLARSVEVRGIHRLAVRACRIVDNARQAARRAELRLGVVLGSQRCKVVRVIRAERTDELSWREHGKRAPPWPRADACPRDCHLDGACHRVHRRGSSTRGVHEAGRAASLRRLRHAARAKPVSIGGNTAQLHPHHSGGIRGRAHSRANGVERGAARLHIDEVFGRDVGR